MKLKERVDPTSTALINSYIFDYSVCGCIWVKVGTMVVATAMAASVANFQKMKNAGGLNEDVLSGVNHSSGGI